jgi:hypothetical protein
MPTRDTRDFISIFNALWYDNFPVIPGHEDIGRAAIWTSHIGGIVKRCSDFKGWFTSFEKGNRTDAVIETIARDGVERSTWANVEWEWKRVSRPINELQKLRNAENEPKVSVFVGYSFESEIESFLNNTKNLWAGGPSPLLIFLIKFSWNSKIRTRKFVDISTFYFTPDTPSKYRHLRSQPALPWEVPGTKWQANSALLVTSDG